MSYLLFIIYLILFCWLITKIRFFRESGLSAKTLIFLFIVKIAAGVFYGFIYSRIPGHKIYADTWRFFYESLEETDLLFRDPLRYFTNIFHNPYDRGYERLFSTSHSYWSDLKSNVMVKLTSVFNIFSLRHYYVNVIFYSFITFFGPVALYRLFNKLFPGKTIYLLAGCFLIPSFLYWCSGIHKDGLIFMAIVFIMHHMQEMIAEEGISLRRCIYIILWLIIILPMRNYVPVALIPPIIAWLLVKKFKRRPWLSFVTVYTFFAALFFTSRFIHPKINLPLSFSIRQTDFIRLKGNSYIPTTKLLPGFKSFVRNLPEALDHSLLRPYPTEIKNTQYLIASVELMAFAALIILFLFKGGKIFNHPAVLFAFFFSVSLFLIIGYIVPNIGAIVRYRSLLLPLIITPMLASLPIFQFKRNPVT
ncbi:MAG: hypothetical protein EKK37_12735 [Sphingobacteriales bacterium]|nr:MAG: hypothetical protein EKK37_12735 [Sphingobacteriales bacterium]